MRRDDGAPHDLADEPGFVTLPPSPPRMTRAGMVAGPARRAFVARVVASAMQFATFGLLSRSSTLGEFGAFSTALGVGAVLSSVLGFGMLNRALRIRVERVPHLAASMTAMMVLSAVTTALCLLVYSFLRDGALQEWALTASVYVASEMVTGLVQSLLFGEQRQRRAESVVVLGRAIPLGFVLVGYHGLAPVPSMATVGFVISSAVALLLLGRQPWYRWQPREVISGGRHYWRSNMLSMLQQLDVSIVGAIDGLPSAGAYGAGFRMASPIHIVTSSIVSVMIPALGEITRRADRAAARRPYVRISLIYAAILVVVSPAAIVAGPAMFGSQYEPYALIFPVFIVNSALSVVNQVQAAVLYAEDEAPAVTACIAVATGMGLALVAIGSLQGLLLAAAGLASSRLVLGALLWARLHVLPDDAAGEA